MGKKKSKRDAEAFWAKVSEHFFQGEASELEYSDFLDFGEAAGLLVQVKYRPKVHGESMVGDPEPGDMIYVHTEAPR